MVVYREDPMNRGVCPRPQPYVFSAVGYVCTPSQILHTCSRSRSPPVGVLRDAHAVRKILVADDDDDLRELVTICLTQAGHEVVGVPDGAAALSEIQTCRHDLVVLDNTMPRMTGLDVLAACRDMESHARPTMMMVSAMATDRDVQAGLAAGADYFMAKPFSCAALVARIDVLLGVMPAEPPDQDRSSDGGLSPAWFGEREIEDEGRA